MTEFKQVLVEQDLALSPTKIDVLQVNITRLCNQACRHCHVDASPLRREMMDRKTIDSCLEVLRAHEEVGTIDVTGGAPELHPDFTYFVKNARDLGAHVIVRHNLTVTLTPHPVTGRSMAYLPDFFAEQGVELICSLPHYDSRLADVQRGPGVFARSIESMRLLNRRGFGRNDAGPTLNLIHNPTGPHLPPAQDVLEQEFRQALADRYGVTFNRLYALTNMPVNRFATELEKRGIYDAYLGRLSSAYNSCAAENVMCRTTVSVAYDGTLYDCDFNQMLDLPIGGEEPATVHEFDAKRLRSREIRVADHCFGCTAGSGSSCGGATT